MRVVWDEIGEVELHAKRTLTCPAGTAYWQLAVLPVVADGEITMDAAIYTEQTRAIYGCPDILLFAERAKPAILERLQKLGMRLAPAAKDA